MRAKTFKGGIHPKEMKELSNKCSITDVFPKTKTVTIPVTMGGAPNSPVVKVGDLVAKGQIIANVGPKNVYGVSNNPYKDSLR